MRSKMYELSRNLQTCSGIKSCGKCIEHISGLKDGPIKVSITGRFYEQNEEKISQAMAACPVGALEFNEWRVNQPIIDCSPDAVGAVPL